MGRRNSNWVTFISDKGLGNTGFFRLFTTSPNNNNNIFISGSIAGTYDVVAFEWAPSAIYVAYTVEVPGNIFQLFTTFPDNATSTQISDNLFDGDEANFGWAPDSSRFAYIADQNTTDVFELYASVPNGSVIDVVSGTPVVGGDVQEFKLVYGFCRTRLPRRSGYQRNCRTVRFFAERRRKRQAFRNPRQRW